jgi:two-component system invasion response regulator UvrY
MLVLIVDSSVHIINRLAEVLAEANYIRAIHKAVTYEEAISFCKQSKPDIVLLDNDLPANKSIDLISEIKKINDTTAIIIMSIRTDKNTREQFYSSGADFFLDKYHDFEKLPGIVDTIGASKNQAGY